jgi:hypothetical protein
MEIALMGLSAVIPDPNSNPAVIYVAGLSDDTHVSVYRLEDSDQGRNWEPIGTYDHCYLFSSLIPLKKAPDADFQQLLLIGGIKPSKQQGKWQFSSSVMKIENKEDFNEQTTLKDLD